MARKDGTAARPLDATLEELSNAPHEFDFYQAMRLLECTFPDAQRFGKSMRLPDEPIRLGQEPSLGFAPASLFGFGPAKNARYHKLLVRFFGLCGPNGALPLHLTEYARDRIRHYDDTTIAAFLDVFHHRMLSLFYRAWADAQPTTHFDRPETDRFSMYVGSLLGIGMPTLRDRDKFPDLAKLYYAGRFGCQAKNPEGLRAMLSDFFKVPCQIEEFVGQWTKLPAESEFRLGDSPDSSSLGVACTLGSHVWDCQQKFRVTIGPIGWDDFARLLPGGDSLQRLTALVRNYIGEELLWDLNLVLKQEETPSWVLGDAKLGQTVWMDNAGVTEDSRDLTLHS
ncbi:type VI secretion system baseplate subunit TssG [Stieleria sp. TO1_6]|uniref:type VI secretion system baseplate subunit TssG n=1 Tax=Stieleria tagensis TaxID=2956795 RepID=UPI00209B0BAA|nr:type VI secretion system baseplate subunit TssG [Stieleria tagensis]MCO8120419.1 type VI secretion system baseplate subunit TssG [Stieleria tagensis]